MKYTIFILICTLIASCGTQYTEKFTVQGIELTAEGPYFEGPNSFNGIIDHAFVEFLQQKNYTKQQLLNVELIDAQIYTEKTDSNKFKNIMDVTLQLVSDSSDMQKVAYLNPLDQNNSFERLKTASEQEDLSELFKQSKIYVVMDANLQKDIEYTLKFKTDLTFNLTFKK